MYWTFLVAYILVVENQFFPAYLMFPMFVCDVPLFVSSCLIF